jgi:hypothetical protein
LRERSCRCGGVVDLEKGATAAAEAKARKGSTPGRMKPKRAEGAARGEIRRRRPQPVRGSKPLKRGRSGRDAYAPKAHEAPL